MDVMIRTYGGGALLWKPSCVYTMCISFQSCYTERKRGLSHSEEALCFWPMVSPTHFQDSMAGEFHKLGGLGKNSDLICTRRLQLVGHIVRSKEDQDLSGLRKRPAGSGSIYAGTEVVEPVSVVRDLDVWIDAELSKTWPHIAHHSCMLLTLTPSQIYQNASWSWRHCPTRMRSSAVAVGLL